MSSTRLSCLIITARKRSLRRLCFYTCQSFYTWGVWGVCPCVCWDTPPPGPDADTLLDQRQTPPGLRQTPPKQTPPCIVHAGKYEQQEGGRYPTGMPYLFVNVSLIIMFTISSPGLKPPSPSGLAP